ncbi:MAG: tyrosine-type recombinase/integrase [bacterium]|nr:tyrosine-type recombinase/integrase [bacterium]
MPNSTRRGKANASETIHRFTPIQERLRVKTAFDFEGQGLPSPAQAYLDSLDSPDSKRNMGYALDVFAAFFSGGRIGRNEIPWHQMTPEHRDALRAHLVERYQERNRFGRKRASPESVNNRLVAWRQVLKHAWDKGLMSGEAYQHTANVKVVKGQRQKKRKFVPEEHLARVFQHCALDPNRPAGARDAALLSLLFGCGLRRFEAIGLELEDIDRQPHGWTLTVVGKRNKERTVGVPIGAAAFVRDWLDIRGLEPGPLFFPIRKNGFVVVQDRPMTVKVGNDIVDKRFLAAGVPKISPHDLRATSTTILAGLLDVFQTMDWAGHEDANTTRGYVVAANNLAQQIAERLRVPHFEDTGRSSSLSWERLR